MNDYPAFDYTEPTPHQSFDEVIRADHLNLITQVREDYDENGIEELGRIISLVGQLHRVKVAAFKKSSRAQEYLDYFNCWWGLEKEERHQAEDCRRTQSGLCLILISGHRRTKAILSDAVAYPRNEVKVTIYPQIKPQQAALIQLSENNYRQPEAHRKADAIYRLHDLMKKQGSSGDKIWSS